MMLVRVCAALSALLVVAASASPRTVYYFHGKIVEDSGPRGVSERFGAYDYSGIVAALGGPGRTVVSEARARNTDPAAYADRIVADIRARLATGEDPARITVIGASKGAVIATLVSSKLKVAKIRYVLLGNCNDWLIRTFDPHLTGDVLSIYESSDDLGGSCGPLAQRSPAIGRYREIRLSTGLSHGFLYRPLAVWTEPALDWIGR